MTASAKAAMREAVLRRRRALQQDERASLGRRILRGVLDLPSYARSDVVLAYSSFGAELATDEFLSRVLEDEKVLLLPRVERGGLGLYEVRDVVRDLAPGTWSIREPLPTICLAVNPNRVDFALVPGVAFDRTGRRLGYGGGFYDRLLVDGLPGSTPVVSAAFEVQMVDEVPADPHDAPVDVVVTEKGMYSQNSWPANL